MAIITPAHFKVCPDCHSHGHIVFSDGSKGEEAYSESKALLELEKAKMEGKLLEAELAPLKKQILDSEIPLVPGSKVAILGFIDDDQSHRGLHEWALARKAPMN